MSEATKDMYQTTSSDYGLSWQTSEPYKDKFPQSAPYKQLTDTRQVDPLKIPKDRKALAQVHDPAHPCGIMSLSNVPTNTRGEFTNVRRDFHSTHQGLFTNSAFNKPGARLYSESATYSNLQGAWSRVGPSTYDRMHGTGAWANNWAIYTHEAPTSRELHDHHNIDPRDNWLPRDNLVQNMYH